jgi:hypothetical protein
MDVVQTLSEFERVDTMRPQLGTKTMGMNVCISPIVQTGLFDVWAMRWLFSTLRVAAASCAVTT